MRMFPDFPSGVCTPANSRKWMRVLRADTLERFDIDQGELQIVGVEEGRLLQGF